MEIQYPYYFIQGLQNQQIKVRAFTIEREISIQNIISAIDIVHGSDFCFPGEAHPFWEMVYVVDGKIGVTADNKLYTLSSGDLIFHKPMEFHKIWTEGAPAHVNIYSFTAKGAGLGQLENYTGHVKSSAGGLLREICSTAQMAFVYEDYTIQSVCNEKKAHIFANLLENFLLEVRSNTSQSATEDKDSRIFFMVVNFLNENLDSQLTVDHIAQQCRLSASMVKKIFHKYADMGVIAYFNMLKIKKAMELLDAGNTISATSEKLAFSNQFYFSTVFKKQTGFTPSEYKRMRSHDH